MDVLEEELLKFWKALNDHQVRYIMVGGFATRFHGFNRSTDDLDLWLEDTKENRKRLRKAFSECGYGDLPFLETMPFVPGWTNFKIGGVELDILTEMKGLEHPGFDECLMMASIADLEGINVPFLHINHLIMNKKIINRPKDQIDVIELEKIRKLREDGI
jgi:predicted nucleotidyltransferase